MSGIYDLVDNLYKRRGSKIVVNSAFLADHRASIYKLLQDNIDRNGNVRQNSQVHKQAMSVRQMAEWGMGSLQGSFPHLKD